MKRGLIIFFLLNVIHFHVCKPNGETDADLTAEDGLTMVDALEDDGDMMEVEDRAASGYDCRRPTAPNYCSDHRWVWMGCNKVWKQWIFDAKRICSRICGPRPPTCYENCLYYQISNRKRDNPYCWPCNCRAIYTIGCEQGHLEKKVAEYLLGKFQCYS